MKIHPCIINLAPVKVRRIELLNVKELNNYLLNFHHNVLHLYKQYMLIVSPAVVCLSRYLGLQAPSMFKAGSEKCGFFAI